MDRISISLCSYKNDGLANCKKGVNIFQKLKLPSLILLTVDPDLFNDIEDLVRCKMKSTTINIPGFTQQLIIYQMHTHK